MIDKRLGTHNSRFTPVALAKAFKTWSEDDRVEFIHLIGAKQFGPHCRKRSDGGGANATPPTPTEPKGKANAYR
jgi:hypothetical protein